MRRSEFITLVVLSGKEKKARAAGCDDSLQSTTTAGENSHFLQ
jgi:hypothetical protein